MSYECSSEEGNCNLSRNIQTASTYDAAKLKKANLQDIKEKNRGTFLNAANGSQIQNGK
jgi:hypothetical protein